MWNVLVIRQKEEKKFIFGADEFSFKFRLRRNLVIVTSALEFQIKFAFSVGKATVLGSMII